jgi:hypothetical protein
MTRLDTVPDRSVGRNDEYFGEKEKGRSNGVDGTYACDLQINAKTKKINVNPEPLFNIKFIELNLAIEHISF